MLDGVWVAAPFTDEFAAVNHRVERQLSLRLDFKQSLGQRLKKEILDHVHQNMRFSAADRQTWFTAVVFSYPETERR